MEILLCLNGSNLSPVNREAAIAKKKRFWRKPVSLSCRILQKEIREIFTHIATFLPHRAFYYFAKICQITFWEVGLLLENQVCFRSLVKIHLSFFVEVNIFNCQQWQFYSLKILISTLKLFKNPFSSYYRIKLNFDLNSTSFVFS